MLNKVHEISRLIIKKVRRYAYKAWYAPLLTLLAALDNFLLIIPNDSILISSSMIVKRRWILFAFFVAIGSTIGAMGLVKVVQHMGLPWILDIFEGVDQTRTWKWSEDFMENYGVIMVFLVGITPFSQQPVLILASLSHFSDLSMITAIFLSRIFKFLLMAYVGAFAPKLLSKFWGVKGELKDAGIDIK
jgi:membrane protein YqaA with SNARE-associated domain